MPLSLARIRPPVSFSNFSSAAALAPSVATARHASPVTRNRRFIEFFLVLIEAILGRSPSASFTPFFYSAKQSPADHLPWGGFGSTASKGVLEAWFLISPFLPDSHPS